MRDYKGGTGESRVYIRSKEEYHKEILPDSIDPIATIVCDYYDLPLPEFEVRPNAKNLWGRYYSKRKLVTLNMPIKLGVLLHELAHYINDQKNIHRNGHHDYGFSSILNEMFEIWNI
jgi:hypothetical protein